MLVWIAITLAGHVCAPVAALRDETIVTQAFHQNDPGFGDTHGIPTQRRGCRRKAVPGQRGDDEVERVVGGGAVRRRVGQRSDDLELLDDRSGPAVRYDQRERVLVLRAHVNEVNLLAVDLR
jgi:hypothetical protein